MSRPKLQWEYNYESPEATMRVQLWVARSYDESTIMSPPKLQWEYNYESPEATMRVQLC